MLVAKVLEQVPGPVVEDQLLQAGEAPRLRRSVLPQYQTDHFN